LWDWPVLIIEAPTAAGVQDIVVCGLAIVGLEQRNAPAADQHALETRGIEPVDVAHGRAKWEPVPHSTASKKFREDTDCSKY